MDFSLSTFPIFAVRFHLIDVDTNLLQRALSRCSANWTVQVPHGAQTVCIEITASTKSTN